MQDSLFIRQMRVGIFSKDMDFIPQSNDKLNGGKNGYLNEKNRPKFPLFASHFFTNSMCTGQSQSS